MNAYFGRSWLYPVFTTSDADLVRTAGLDSLMLIWTASLGIQVMQSDLEPTCRERWLNTWWICLLINNFHAVQIFLPLTVIGMAICEWLPICCHFFKFHLYFVAVD